MNIEIHHGNTASSEDIHHLENDLDVQFPSEYIDLMKRNNGGHIKPNCFKVGENTESINNFYDIKKIYNFKDKYLPEGLVPFARDAGGNQICFDYRIKGRISILFWDHELESYDDEQGLCIAESFATFLESLFFDGV